VGADCKLKLIAIIVVLLLGGCAATAEVRTQIVYKPVEVQVPVKTPCLTKEQIPVEPKYELDDKGLASKSIYEKGMATLKEIEQRKEWQMSAKALLESCLTVQ